MAVTTTPPRVLSMEQYQSYWKPQGWQLIIIGPTSTWRQDWGEWEAIRDIVQNALDEAEYYTWGYDDGLWIMDKGKGVAVADFLLGPPKLKADYARGKFGEGMKIATLALIRKGYSIHVKTVGRELWVIFMEQKVDGKVDTLAAMWRPGGMRVGTEFHIIGYSGPAFERCFAVNLPQSLILAETPSPVVVPKIRYNQLIKAEGMASSSTGGVIYSRDIFLREIKSTFSYNLWGFELAPDRHGPKNEADMWMDAGRLWCGISNVFLLEDFLPMVMEPARVTSDETHNIRMSSYMGADPITKSQYLDLLKEHASAWQTAWHKVAGTNAVIKTTDRWDGMVKHIGYVSVGLQWGVRDALSTVITSDKELVQRSQEALRQVKVVPDIDLTKRAFTHLKLARAIASRFSDVAGVYGAIIPPASDRVRTAGLYDMGTQEIILHLETLERAEKTIDAMVHELGHHVALERTEDPVKAEDLQPAHSEAMTYIASVVFGLAANKAYDEYLQEAVW